MRRNGVFNDQKFVINNNTWQNTYAVYVSTGSGPTFGGGYDINICDNSNIVPYSSSYFCVSYVCPYQCTSSAHSWSCGRSYLAGSYDGWLTTEIEVFQLTISDYIASTTTKTKNFETKKLITPIYNTPILPVSLITTFRTTAKIESKL